MRWKMLPKRVALFGAAATALSISASFGTEAYCDRTFRRNEYVWMNVVVPTLFTGVPLAFIGTILWARQLEAATRIAAALVLFFMCLLIYFSQPNIHGAGGLLLLIFVAALPLGVVLLIMGFRQ
jgi:hypothetical protein